MTKKDFELIADVLNANHAPYPLVLDFADLLEETNERFDRKRFVFEASHELRADLAHTARILAKNME